MTAFAGEFRFGFLPLVDAAPLIIARELGFFAAEGLHVTLSREPSWAAARDNLRAGLLDGAHMLAHVVAETARQPLDGASFVAPIALNANGAAVVVSDALAREAGGDLLLDPARLAGLVGVRARSGAPLLRFGVVHASSIHADLLTAWLADAAVDPGDVRIQVLPPDAMTRRLAAGELDGFCAGAPWPQVTCLAGEGAVVARSGAARPGSPDKVFAVSRTWAFRNADALTGAVRALRRAQIWADEGVNRPALVRLLEEVLKVEARALLPALEAEYDQGGVVFSRGGAGRPDADWARSLLGRPSSGTTRKPWAPVADDNPFRPDLYDRALAPRGTAPPF